MLEGAEAIKQKGMGEEGADEQMTLLAGDDLFVPGQK